VAGVSSRRPERFDFGGADKSATFLSFEGEAGGPISRYAVGEACSNASIRKSAKSKSAKTVIW
jgi:hypothetical protein